MKYIGYLALVNSKSIKKQKKQKQAVARLPSE